MWGISIPGTKKPSNNIFTLDPFDRLGRKFCHWREVNNYLAAGDHRVTNRVTLVSYTRGVIANSHRPTPTRRSSTVGLYRVGRCELAVAHRVARVRLRQLIVRCVFTDRSRYLWLLVRGDWTTVWALDATWRVLSVRTQPQRCRLAGHIIQLFVDVK